MWAGFIRNKDRICAIIPDFHHLKAVNWGGYFIEFQYIIVQIHVFVMIELFVKDTFYF